MKEKKEIELIEEMLTEFLESMEDAPEEFTKILEEDFWDMLA